jgi:hypothetical protein
MRLRTSLLATLVITAAAFAGEIREFDLKTVVYDIHYD